jgi:hypothetical protein
LALRQFAGTPDWLGWIEGPKSRPKGVTQLLTRCATIDYKAPRFSFAVTRSPIGGFKQLRNQSAVNGVSGDIFEGKTTPIGQDIQQPRRRCVVTVKWGGNIHHRSWFARHTGGIRFHLRQTSCDYCASKYTIPAMHQHKSEKNLVWVRMYYDLFVSNYPVFIRYFSKTFTYDKTSV